MRANPTSAGERRRSPARDPARSRVVTWHDPSVILAASRGCSGLDTLRAIRDGDLPSPPMVRLLQMDLVDLEEGRVEVRCAVDESVYGPLGVVHGGLVATLLDTVAGWAVHSTLHEAAGFTSIELKVSFLRPVHISSGPLTAVGAVVRPGRRVALAQGQVRDTAGQIVATASSSLLLFTLPSGPEAPTA